MRGPGFKSVLLVWVPAFSSLCPAVGSRFLKFHLVNEKSQTGGGGGLGEKDLNSPLDQKQDVLPTVLGFKSALGGLKGRDPIVGHPCAYYRKYQAQHFVYIRSTKNAYRLEFLVCKHQPGHTDLATPFSPSLLQVLQRRFPRTFL